MSSLQYQWSIRAGNELAPSRTFSIGVPGLSLIQVPFILVLSKSHFLDRSLGNSHNLINSVHSEGKKKKNDGGLRLLVKQFCLMMLYVETWRYNPGMGVAYEVQTSISFLE